MHRKGGPKGATGPPSVHLPKDLYSLFEPKTIIPFWKNRSLKKTYKQPLIGLGKLIQEKFNEPTNLVNPIQNVIVGKEETLESKIVKHAAELKQIRKLRYQCEYSLKTQNRLLSWDPHEDNGQNKTSNGYLTLFIARLSSQTKEEEVKEFMKQYGQVVSVKLVKNLKHPLHCYGFVEFADEASLQKAYKMADGQEFGGGHLLVDVERGRTVSAWVPRRFGGGLGGPPKLKGYTVRKGRGQPEPPKVNVRKRRPFYQNSNNERPPHPRMS